MSLALTSSLVQAVLMQWDSYAAEHHNSERGHKVSVPPVEKMLVATELGLDQIKQQLQEVNRNPGENNVRMCGHTDRQTRQTEKTER